MKTNCTSCGSSDGKEVYPDGGTHCFVCEETTFPDGPRATPQAKPAIPLVTTGEYHGARSITRETMLKFKYKIDLDKGIHIAPYYCKDGNPIAQHIRLEGSKDKMPWKGKTQPDMQMFGQQLWGAGASKRIVVCEGEIDTLSVSESLGNTWATVGIPGASSTEKSLKANLEFLQRFDEIVLFFDNDEAGKEATKTALKILPHNKTKFVKEYPIGCNDANDILVRYGGKTLRETVFYKTEHYIPAEVKPVDKIEITDEDFAVTLFPWGSWNKKLFARRSGELTVYTSGSGMGKSTIMRYIYHNLLQQNESCGMIMLEESTQETKADLMSSLLNKPIRRIIAQRGVNKALESKGLPKLFEDIPELNETEMKLAEAELDQMPLHIVDHVGGYNARSLLDKIRFMAISLGVKNILLDHITLMISSDETIDNEVKSTDVIMKQLRSLAEECNINIDIISHIRKRGGGQKSTYGGAQITMEELRGSGSLYQVANNVICLERDQHDEEAKNVTTVRSLKSRLSGYTGIIGALEYDETTGELRDVDSETSFQDESTEY